MLENVSGVPSLVVESLTRLQDDLIRMAGDNLGGLILYGGLARGRYRPGKSDINVVVLLKEISAPALTAIGPALRAARRSAGVVPLILALAEVRHATAVFPVKFLDIRDHHIVLYGADPFVGLEAPREQVRMRIVQELSNLIFRLRLRFIASAEDIDMQETTLANLARPLAVGMAALLRLAGKPTPDEDRTAAIFQAAVAAFGLDGDALARIAELRQGSAPAGDLSPLFTRLFTMLARLLDCAEAMKEVPA
jgi:hypothetical protein